MKIDKNNLKLGIWYEDENNNRIPIKNDDSIESPPGAHTYHFLFPLDITEHVYTVRSEEIKEKCKHQRRYLKKDRGLIKGLKGRICCNCGCSQTRKWWQPWGKKWSDGSSIAPLIDFHTHIGGDNEQIILAIANSGEYTLSEAIAVYVSACERCVNVLEYKYTNGKGGYPEYSEEWYKANTVCDFCKDDREI